jgi:maltose alpha-D-glucosyltransferase/alpha-amylase
MTDKATSDLWWKNAVIYCADVATWLDSDGDGTGDLAGLTRRLDYLWSLGVSTLWLMPFYPSPRGDDGYDITDYYAVDPRLGTLGDFVEMIRTADNLGIRVLVDLVMSHTSNEHPWFRQSRRDRGSRYRHFYRWSDTKQAEPSEVAFPGEQTSTWTYDDAAGQFYMHRYYDFMPDLNITDPDVLDEMHKVLGFWLELGISGFRVDSLPFMIETVGTDAKEQPVTYLRSLVEFLERRRGDAIFLGEANVSPQEQQGYFAVDGGDGVQMLFDFRTCAAQWLAHARGSAGPLVEALRSRGRPSCCTGTRSGWARTCRCPDGWPCGTRCSGRPAPRGASRPAATPTGRSTPTGPAATTRSTWPASATTPARSIPGWPRRSGYAATVPNSAGVSGARSTSATSACWASRPAGTSTG